MNASAIVTDSASPHFDSVCVIKGIQKDGVLLLARDMEDQQTFTISAEDVRPALPQKRTTQVAILAPGPHQGKIGRILQGSPSDEDYLIDADGAQVVVNRLMLTHAG